MRILFISIVILIAATSCKSKYQKAADEIVSKAPEPTNMNVGKEKYNLYHYCPTKIGINFSKTLYSKGLHQKNTMFLFQG